MSEFVKKIDWQKISLLPVVVQDSSTNEVLMVAYMNQEALELSLKTNIAHYYSRSKNRIWMKGESSGHTQEIENFALDCDDDTLLIKVKQNGVACHTGRKSCFYKDFKNSTKQIEPSHSASEIYGIVDTLYHTIQERKGGDTNSSWSAKLMSKGENAILKKVIEECGEFSLAYKDNDTKEIIYEAADLLYHMLVALAYRDISPDKIRQELLRRTAKSGIEEKNSRAT